MEINSKIVYPTIVTDTLSVRFDNSSLEVVWNPNFAEAFNALGDNIRFPERYFDDSLRKDNSMQTYFCRRGGATKLTVS